MVVLSAPGECFGPMPMIRADGALFRRQCQCQGRYRKRYLLVCQFGSPLRSAPNSQTSNLYCHPSLQDCAGTSPSQTCGRPTAQMALAARLPHFKEEAVTVSSQLFRSLRLLHNCQLTVLVYAPPAPHGERIITREPQCQRERRAPYPAFHNIIPSELCNSRRHRQYPAPAESNINGSEARKNGLQGV